MTRVRTRVRYLLGEQRVLQLTFRTTSGVLSCRRFAKGSLTGMLIVPAVRSCCTWSEVKSTNHTLSFASTSARSCSHRAFESAFICESICHLSSCTLALTRKVLSGFRLRMGFKEISNSALAVDPALLESDEGFSFR